MPALLDNPGKKKKHSYVSDQNPLIILVSVIMHQSQATMVLLTVKLSKSTTSLDKHRHAVRTRNVDCRETNHQRAYQST